MCQSGCPNFDRQGQRKDLHVCRFNDWDAVVVQHGEDEVHGAVAARRRRAGEVMRESARHFRGDLEVAEGVFVQTHRRVVNGDVERRVDGEVQRHHTVATVDGLQRVGVGSGSGEILSEEVVTASSCVRP